MNLYLHYTSSMCFYLSNSLINNQYSNIIAETENEQYLINLDPLYDMSNINHFPFAYVDSDIIKFIRILSKEFRKDRFTTGGYLYKISIFQDETIPVVYISHKNVSISIRSSIDHNSINITRSINEKSNLIAYDVLIMWLVDKIKEIFY